MCRSVGHLLCLNLLLFTFSSACDLCLSFFLTVCTLALQCYWIYSCRYPCAELEEGSNISVPVGSCFLFLSNIMCTFTIHVCILSADNIHVKLISNDKIINSKVFSEMQIFLTSLNLPKEFCLNMNFSLYFETELIQTKQLISSCKRKSKAEKPFHVLLQKG